MSERVTVVVEERRFSEVKKGWVVWDQNGAWREVERLGEDWVHEESGASGPTLLLRLAPSATIRMTGARSSIVLRRLAVPLLCASEALMVADGSYCEHDESHGAGIGWYADNVIWNAVMGEPGWERRLGELAYLGPPGVLCLPCFCTKARERGVRVLARVVADADYSAHHAMENAESWGEDGRYWRENGADDSEHVRTYLEREVKRMQACLESMQ